MVAPTLLAEPREVKVTPSICALSVPAGAGTLMSTPLAA
jgi:hypothetical protein